MLEEARFLRPKQLAQEIRTKQRQQIRNQTRKQFYHEAYPLHSSLLQHFHEVHHKDLYKYIEQINETLMNTNLQIIQEEQHDLVVNDLFYLLHEIPQFVIYRGIKFLKNQSILTASLIALISVDVMPKQLAYWLQFMSDEDKDIVYLGIIGDNNHYLSWVMHPILRDSLLEDMKYMKSAAEAVKQIVGYRRYNIQKLMTKNGHTLDQILIQKFTDYEQGMQKTFFCSEYLQISIWTIKTKWKSQQTKDLIDLLNKTILHNLELVKDIFIIWAIECMKEGYLFLNKNTVIVLMDSIRNKQNFMIINQNHYEQFRKMLAIKFS